MSLDPLIYDEFRVDQVLLEGATAFFWNEGWRHFGGHYYRYNMTFEEDRLIHIVPVRINLKEFQFSKSQRRVLRKNADLEIIWRKAEVNDELEDLFHRHKSRFKSNVPSSLLNFVDPDVGHFPCRCDLLECRLNGILVAASYCDNDGDACSSVYGMFDPDHSHRGLGQFTLLLEIQRALEEGKRWHYLGYASVEPGIYDYKKNFSALQGYNWMEKKWYPEPGNAFPVPGLDPVESNSKTPSAETEGVQVTWNSGEP